MKKLNENKILGIIICALMACGFVILFSYSTSIFYKYYFGGDSAQFLTIGRGWYFGKIPYIDLMDHKGPFIFWVNYLGYLFTGGNGTIGVMFIQILFASFSAFAFYEIVSLYTDSNIVKWLVVFATFAFMKQNYVDGNTVEEYCLPFISWSFYYILKYLRDGKVREHDYKVSLIYGMTVGVCFLTRLTNCIVIVGGVFCVLLILLRNKLWINILQNLLFGLLGVTILVLPFVVYFALKGALYEFLYGTFLFNLKYASNAVSWIDGCSFHNIIRFLRLYIMSWIIIPLGVYNFFVKKYNMSLFCILTGIMEVYLYTHGFLLEQYPFVCAPQLILFWAMMIDVIKRKRNLIIRCTAILFLISFFVLMVIICKDAINGSVVTYRKSHNRNAREWECLVDEIPVDDLDKFVVSGDYSNSFKEVYLLKEIQPCYKYFVIQQFHAEFGDDIKEQIRKEFLSCKAKYILTTTDVRDSWEILDILDKYYYEYDRTQNYCLLKRNN